MEAAAKLHEMHEQARAVVMSGYANDAVMADYEAYGFLGCIKKPVDMDELVDTVGMALTSADWKSPSARTIPCKNGSLLLDEPQNASRGEG